MSQTPPLNNAATLWSAPPEARVGRPLVLLLHGYGADERDLFSLVPHLPDDFAYAAVRAPLTPPWPETGYSWYPIEGLDSRDPVATTAAAERLWEWIDATAPETVGILGFSQGGAIAIQALRLRPDALEFAINLSGYATPGELPRDAEMRELQPALFWGRGADDTVIPQPLIAHTTEWLPAQCELSGRVYPKLGHAISMEELADVTAFLQRRLPVDEPRTLG